MKKENTEEIIISEPLSYPLREIHFYDNTDTHFSIALLDELLYREVEDMNERLLLWRPRYVGIETYDSFVDTRFSDDSDDESISNMIKSLLDVLEINLDRLVELEEESEGTSTSRAASSLIIPKLPSSIRKQKEIDRKKRVSAGWARAITLLLGFPDDRFPTRFELGERIFIQIVVIHYRSMKDDEERMMILENPLSKRLRDTIKSGRALTRLVSLNEKCFEMIRNLAF